MIQTLNPESLKKYRIRKQKPILTITRDYIIFNNGACFSLALKKGDQFVFDFECPNLFYRDVGSKGFTISRAFKGDRGLCCPAKGFDLIISELTGKNCKYFAFEIGEFKEGRRKLTLISTGKEAETK
jgi:hypothetical protein